MLMYLPHTHPEGTVLSGAPSNQMLDLAEGDPTQNECPTTRREEYIFNGFCHKFYESNFPPCQGYPELSPHPLDPSQSVDACT